jgi:23S rRNA (uridine2552-2'-O)-methyltransferase
MTTHGPPPPSGKRALGFLATRRAAVRVKKAKGRKASSTRWLKRQLNDPYVAAAQREGYRSRAAYKLIDLDRRFGLLKRGARVAELGAAPGGWAQVVAQAVGGKGRVVALDKLAMEPIAGVKVLTGDAAEPGMAARLRDALGGAANLVLSDMAPAATGHRETDHLRIMALAEVALALAEDVLAPGGVLVLKVWQGGAEPALLAALKRRFAKVRHAKPTASRRESSELYLVAQGFRPAPS